MPDKRIIKGRPFGVGLIVRIITYNQERPSGKQTAKKNA